MGTKSFKNLVVWQKSHWLIFLFSIFYFLFSAPLVYAATLYFSPSSGTYTVGSTVSVSAYVSSVDQAINAASGVISFSKDKLEVVSLSKTGSVFSLWVQEPSFSNSAGTVNFEGILLNPGFTGTSGKLITVNFRIKAAGIAALNFSSGSVLANDGQGTNILTSLGNASFSLGGAGPAAPEAEIPPAVAGTPAAPQIFSPTHSDPNKWYALNDAKFTWSLSPDITGVRLLVGRIPNAVPTVTYIPPIDSRELSDLADGIWYFHVRLRNNAGWGGISHFRFQIDTEKPSKFEIQKIKREDKTNPRVKFVFDSRDETSGIDHYEVQIDDGGSQIWQDDGSGVFETPVLGPGKHTLIAKAFDKAGNSLANSAEFIIEALEPPIITDYPKELASDEILIVKGYTYACAQAVIWLQRGKDEPKGQIVKCDNNGNFTFIAEEKLKDGIYRLWTESVDERGARSKPTDKATIVVEQPAILKIGTRAVTILTIVVPLVALIILLLALIWYGWHKFLSFRKKIRKETKEAEQALRRAIKLLKEDIKNQIKLLEKTKSKRQLTEEEGKIIKQLRKDLDDAEKFVGKEIKDIEKINK